MAKTPLISAFVTGASADDIAAPTFNGCVENWLRRCRRIYIVVDRKAPTLNIRGVHWVRVKNEQVMLRDVLEVARKAMDGTIRDIVIADPTVKLSSKLMAVYPVVAKRQLGLAWAATAQAIRLDEDGQGGVHEEEALRFFMLAESLVDHTRRKPVEDAPFTSPLWGGVLATWLQENAQLHRYHDITSLNAVAVHGEPNGELFDGYGPLTFNLPPRNYVRTLAQQTA